MADQNSSMSGVNSHLEMGSLEGRSVLELEDESLSSPRMISIKTSSLDAAPRRYFCDVEEISCRCILRRAFNSIRIVLLSDKLNILVLCGPLAILVDKLTSHHGWVFLLSLLGIIPLAERLGWATEQLAFFTGPTVGGLLNATFGNATELIISMYALRSGMIRVVQQSLLGSILSNMLLVLGCAFFGGGIVHSNKEQVFDKANAVMNSGLLLMAVMGLLFPAVLHFTRTELHFGKSELALSRFSSCVMLAAYGAYLFFQLTSQKNMYSPINEGESQDDSNSDDEEAPQISKWESISWLSILTVWISVLSEYLVNAIEGASVAMNIPVAFISVILLPIVGNAAEHAGAVMFAVKDKLDISLGVAIGSSTQISMFGIPFCVVVGWIMGRPMDLNFQLFETATLFMTVLVVAFMLQEGTSNYFKGLMLLLCYLIVAASFFVHIDPKSIQDKPKKT
ncbi:vacuolar cation/proton exchanger 3-like [Coffea eugenioides]|uniref:Vacuolar cation/proton exchanger n=1 Tax=Coffea arabica TaxID=13443 RepID=A0A6P6S8Z7_COFAR|nr:vacuolar cation/proton exchanger 3-like [Coffea eugenioides]